MIGKIKDVIFLLIQVKVEAIPISSSVKEIQLMPGFAVKKEIVMSLFTYGF